MAIKKCVVCEKDYNCLSESDKQICKCCYEVATKVIEFSEILKYNK